MDAKIKDADGVYYPREDSYLLAEAVSEHARGEVLDLGTGSGIQGITAALNGCSVTFSDIDGRSLEAARSNAKGNNVGGGFILSDMFSGIDGRFDTIIFNPPYLPSGQKRELALDGGKAGRELIEIFLTDYKRHLKPGGVALLLESSFSSYEKEVAAGARALARAHYFFEDLVVLELR
ncbi:MAG: methyltransferase [Candidatus Micrarchaeota archaeon]|nr:methyltransferase [Candidatus Micrarchaeota archaeon]